MTVTRTGAVDKRQSGQTLIIALIVMGILLVIGLYFSALLNRAIVQSGRFGQSSLSRDLAEAGIRYAHYQMQYSELGADWHPNATLPIFNPTTPDVTVDPDALYLRPASGLQLRSNTDTVYDLGGPDGLGPFTRLNYPGGRSLVRARYGPSDPNVLLNQPSDGPGPDPLQNPTGDLTQPGKARNYLIIESIGRPGVVDPNDPTTLPASIQTDPPTTRNIQFRNYGGNGQLMRDSMGAMKARDRVNVTSKKLIAFVSIGLTDAARFITNLNRVSRAADIGIPTELGANFGGAQVNPPMIWGGEPIPGPSGTFIYAGGSLISNADILLHGYNRVTLNTTLGDKWLINGVIAGADGAATLDVTKTTGNSPAGDRLIESNASATLNGNPTTSRLSSRSSGWSTFGGILRDGIPALDVEGFSRYVGRIEPPLISALDPTTGRDRYTTMTRDSGIAGPAGNSGRFAHGQGVYVNNFSDLQMSQNPDDQANLGSAESLMQDWMNPNNGRIARSGWDGSFYLPTGSYLVLNYDGFTITRDGQYDTTRGATERTWRRPDGTNTGLQTCRFRVGAGPNGRPYIINQFTPGVADINAASPNYSLGQEFNGVLLFEGNVRVRGVIPTDLQMTVVSHGSIYIEGSITKGIIGSNGARINRPSGSMLMLMARQYVAVNPTQFFGRTPGSAFRARGQDTNQFAPHPIEMASVNDALSFNSEFLLDPKSNLGANVDPSTWAMYAATYREWTNSSPVDNGPGLNTQLLLSHYAPSGLANISIDVNYGLGTTPPATPTWTYLFPRFPAPATNIAAQYFSGGGNVPIYGLGDQGVFESTGFTLVPFGALTQTSVVGPVYGLSGSPQGTYQFIPQDRSFFTIRPDQAGPVSPGSYLLARAAVVPHDVRIEASVYAEQGSFVVIPGLWQNWNPNDTRQNYTTDQDRYENYGSTPEYPFYGEPIDVKINILGSVSENMPPQMSMQAEWLKKWGWIPAQLGASGHKIPKKHASGIDLNAIPYAPNIVITYDPALATARPNGFDNLPTNPYIRVDEYGRALPPLPRLPVSSTLAYFGEVNP